MRAQFSILNECLVLLKSTEMQPIKKLRIEIQLIQMKRLLNDDFPFVSCEDTLREVLSELRRIGRGEHDADTVSSLLVRVRNIAHGANCEQ